MTFDLGDYLTRQRTRVHATLERLLPQGDGPADRVLQAMRHAVLGGGKRLRPILALAAAEACQAADPIDGPAAALELIHTYSLVHDDLPAMDDDDLRRGRPTVHREFGEATAILAGDGLLTLAFEVLATEPPGPERALARCEAVATVASAAGIAGMVGGQQADLEAEGHPVELERLDWIHGRKTGALIGASAELGALLADAGPELRAAFRRFGRNVGLAFQVTDDLLDRSGSAEQLGKTPGKDARAGKATYPALIGPDASREQARAYVEDACAELAGVGRLSDPLRALAEYAVSRER